MRLQEVFDHFQHPRNQGEIKNPDVEALVGNPACGDILKVMLKIDGERITEISVSDPNREHTKFHLSVSAKIEKQGENFVIVWNEI